MSLITMCLICCTDVFICFYVRNYRNCIFHHFVLYHCYLFNVRKVLMTLYKYINPAIFHTTFLYVTIVPNFRSFYKISLIETSIDCRMQYYICKELLNFHQMETKTKATIATYITLLSFLYFNLWCFGLPLFEDSFFISLIFPPKQLSGKLLILQLSLHVQNISFDKNINHYQIIKDLGIFKII